MKIAIAVHGGMTVKCDSCDFCGNPVSEEMKRLYGKHCSWTCLSRHRKADEAEKERKREEKQRRAQQRLRENIEKMAKKNRRPVKQYSENGETLLGRYECARIAAEAIGCSTSAIHQACRGEREKCRGFVWKYEKKTEAKEK